MPASSTDSCYHRLRLRQLSALCQVIQASGLRTIGHLRRKYEEQALYFEETLRAARALRLVRIKGEELMLTRATCRLLADTDTLAVNLIMRALRCRNAHGEELRKYLASFRVADRAVVRPLPPPQQASIEAGVRNFLMDAGCLSFEEHTKRYVLSGALHRCFSLAVEGAQVVSGPTLAARLAQRRASGAAAETAALAFERRRVGPAHEDAVQHVAAVNTAAGYDIVSVTIEAGGVILPRYVEVKATHEGSVGFYWSAHEREVAASLRAWYFLYLVPLDASGAARIEQLQIVQDPHTCIIEQGDGWKVEVDVMFCSRNGGTQTGEALVV